MDSIAIFKVLVMWHDCNNNLGWYDSLDMKQCEEVEWLSSALKEVVLANARAHEISPCVTDEPRSSVYTASFNIPNAEQENRASWLIGS